LCNFMESKIEESGIVKLRAAIIVEKEMVWTKGYGSHSFRFCP